MARCTTGPKWRILAWWLQHLQKSLIQQSIDFYFNRETDDGNSKPWLKGKIYLWFLDRLSALLTRVKFISKGCVVVFETIPKIRSDYVHAGRNNLQWNTYNEKFSDSNVSQIQIFGGYQQTSFNIDITSKLNDSPKRLPIESYCTL